MNFLRNMFKMKTRSEIKTIKIVYFEEPFDSNNLIEKLLSFFIFQKYDTFSRTIATDNGFGHIILKLAEVKNWSKICILMTTLPRHFEYILTVIRNFSSEINVTVSDRFTFNSIQDIPVMKERYLALKYMKQNCRGKNILL